MQEATAALQSRLPGVLPILPRFRFGARLLCRAPPLWWRRGRPRTVHRSYAEVELLSRLAQVLMPREPIGELFRDFPVKPSDVWGSRWLCPDITTFGVLKEPDAALFVEYDGCHWHGNEQGKQRDERKTAALLAYAPAGSFVLRIGHVSRSLRRMETSTAMEAMVDVWRAGHVPSLTTSLHQATRTLLSSLEGALEREVHERLRAIQGAETLPGCDKACMFVTEAVLTRDVETKKANMRAVLEVELQLSRATVESLENKFPKICGVSIESRFKPVVAWLEDVGLSRQQVAKVVAGHPQVLGYSIDGNMKPTVAWLEDVGLSRQQVAKVVAGSPAVLGYSINANLKPTVVWLEHVGLSRQQVAKVVAGKPQVLGYSIDGNLKPTVAWLECVGLSRQQVAKIVATCPAVLGYSIVANLSVKHQLLQGFFCDSDICRMLVYLPAFFGYSIKRLHHRLHVLQKSGQTRKLAASMTLTDKRFEQRFGA